MSAGAGAKLEEPADLFSRCTRIFQRMYAFLHRIYNVLARASSAERVNYAI